MTNIFIFIIYRKQHNFILIPNPSKYSFSHSLAQRKGKLHLNPKNFISASISGFRLLSTKTRVANRSPFHFNVSATWWSPSAGKWGRKTLWSWSAQRASNSWSTRGLPWFLRPSGTCSLLPVYFRFYFLETIRLLENVGKRKEIKFLNRRFILFIFAVIGKAKTSLINWTLNSLFG